MSINAMNRIVGWGVDLKPEDRPGVPQELPPRPIGNAPLERTLEQQHNGRPASFDALRPLTPVYGTTVPERGLSGAIRRAAYRVPPYLTRRWMLLLLADRIDVVEHNVRPLVSVLAGSALLVAGITLAVRASRSRRFVYVY